MPTSEQILSRQLDVIQLIKRGVPGSRLKAAEAADCLDFLNGLAAALPVHQHMAYLIFNGSCEITAKAAAREHLATTGGPRMIARRVNPVSALSVWLNYEQ